MNKHMRDNINKKTFEGYSNKRKRVFESKNKYPFIKVDKKRGSYVFHFNNKTYSGEVEPKWNVWNVAIEHCVDLVDGAKKQKNELL